MRCTPWPRACSTRSTPGWRPGPVSRPRLTGAYLAKAAWSGVNLAGVDLESVDLNEANLSSANLKQSLASQAQFHRANLRRAVLDSCVAICADLHEADLSSVTRRQC